MDKNLPALVRPQDAEVAARLLKSAAWSETGCLMWTRCRSGRGRYGSISVKKWQGDRKTWQFRTHRVAYELFVGPIPAGFELDHICHTESNCNLGVDCPHRLCLNPAHLRPVTHTENVLTGRSPSAQHAVKTHCIRNHPFFGPEASVYITPKGGRQCRRCKAMLKTGKAISSRKA